MKLDGFQKRDLKENFRPWWKRLPDNLRPVFYQTPEGVTVYAVDVFPGSRTRIFSWSMCRPGEDFSKKTGKYLALSGLRFAVEYGDFSVKTVGVFPSSLDMVDFAELLNSANWKG